MKKESTTTKFEKEQIALSKHRKLAEKNAATPEEAFQAPKDKNKQDRLLSAYISLSLSAKTEFELFSYRVITPAQYQYNMQELIINFQKTKNDLS